MSSYNSIPYSTSQLNNSVAQSTNSLPHRHHDNDKYYFSNNIPKNSLNVPTQNNSWYTYICCFFILLLLGSLYYYYYYMNESF